MREEGVRFGQLRLLHLAIAVISGFFGLIGSIAVIATGLTGLTGFWALLTSRISRLQGSVAKTATVICLLYVAGGLFSVVLHLNDPENLQQALMRLAALWYLPLASILAIVKKADLKRVMEVSAASGAIIVLFWVMIELAFWHSRAWAGAGNPGPFATVMAVQYGICVTAAISTDERQSRLLFWAGAVAAALCVLASGMRTVFPALPLIVLTSYWISAGQGYVRPVSRLPGMMAVGLAAALVVSLVAYALQGDRMVLLWQEATAAFEQGAADNSLGHRMAMWEYAIVNIPQQWLTGSGLETALGDMTERTRALYDFHLNKGHFHNLAFTALLRGGIADLGSVVLFLFAPLLMIWRSGGTSSNTGKSLLINLFVVYGLMAMFNLAFGHDILDHYFVAMLALGTVLLKRDQVAPDNEPLTLATGNKAAG